MPAAPVAPPAAPTAPAPAPAQQAPVKAGPAPMVPAPATAGDPFDDAFSRLNDFAKTPVKDGVKPPTSPAQRMVKPMEPESRPAKPPEQTEQRPGDQSIEEEQAAKEQQQQDDQAKADPNAKPADPNAKPDDAKQQPHRESPWRLVETYKKKAQTLETEIAELRTGKGSPSKEFTERMEQIEKRNNELENEIAFVDYQKSKEFTEQYAKPYEQAWTEAMHSLRGLKINAQNAETGQIVARDLTPSDLAGLANMDPADARMEIRTRFPEDYAEVKQHVDKIRALADAQNSRLEEQRSKGGEWRAKQQEEMQRVYKALGETNAKIWTAVNDEAQKKYEFLRPVEGDTVRNEKLEKAVAFVDEALKARANDPRLTVEQRHDAIKRYSALRNRAIGFSTVMHENNGLKAKVAELEKALKDYQSSGPTNGEGRGKESGQMVASGDEIDQALQGLGKYAR